LLWLRIPGLSWMGAKKVDTLDSILRLREWFQYFLIKYDVGYRFVTYSLYNVEVHAFYF
jgi:hypothetical protein